MTVKKSDIYTFLEKRRKKVITEKVTPLDIEIKRLKDESAQMIINASGLINSLNKKDIDSLKESIIIIRDCLDFPSYTLSDIIRSFDFLNDAIRITSHISNHIDYRKIPEINTFEFEVNELRKNINDEYLKIEKAVRSKTSAKQAYQLLIDLGFDVSEMKIQTKNEVMNVNINNELLGLPEKGAAKHD